MVIRRTHPHRVVRASTGQGDRSCTFRCLKTAELLGRLSLRTEKRTKGAVPLLARYASDAPPRPFAQCIWGVYGAFRLGVILSGNPMARRCKASRWATWGSRKRLGNLHLPGVYFIGKYPRAPSQLDVRSPSIVYIGHTVRPLRERLAKFHYSAFDAKAGHYGGTTFSKLYFASKPSAVPRGLYVCVVAVYGHEPARSALIRLLERQYLYRFVQIHDRLPKCNRS